MVGVCRIAVWVMGFLVAEGLSDKQVNCLGKDCNVEISLVNAAASSPANSATNGKCAKLVNTQNAVYTIGIEIGTPAKQFRVVADTGSNVLVIPSASCKSCEKFHKSLYDPKASSTCMLTETASKITYGSGTVEGPLVHDTVKACGISSENQSMLIMKEEKINAFGNFSFDGIMGMGMPKNSMGTTDSDIKTTEDASFFGRTNVDSFSMCFNKGDNPDGVLKLGNESGVNFVYEPVIGKVHWSVALKGASINGKKVKGICDGSANCASIVDSGTTLIMAPRKNLITLFSSLCDSMPKCSLMQGASRSLRTELFLTELLTCESADQLPNLKFHFGDTEIELTHKTYIMKAKTREMKFNNFMSDSLDLNMTLDFTSVETKAEVCVPSFLSMNMPSIHHGSIWIFGIPLMREYTVMYDRNTQDGGPKVGFAKTKECSPCAADHSSDAGKTIEVLTDVGHAKLTPEFIRRPNLILDEQGDVQL